MKPSVPPSLLLAIAISAAPPGRPQERNPVLDSRRCDVKTAAELDAEIRDIFALDAVGRGDEISGTFYVNYSDESVKQAGLIPALERRDVRIVWRKKNNPQVV
jgi:hypothetical protein